MRSFGSILDGNDGVGRGFDTLRVVLAFAVVLWHCFPLTAGSAAPAKATAWWPIIYALVPMFFALSGFLVTGSALRLALGKFAASRALRILPALAVDTLVTVLLIGPALTSLDALSFWAHGDTHRYLLNMVGEIHYYLPGVFQDNPQAAVNGSLWTIRPELGCYLVIGILIGLGWVRDWRKIAVMLVGFAALMAVARYLPAGYRFPGTRFLATPGAKLVPLFLCGSLMFLLRHRIPYSLPLFVASIAIIVGCGFVIDYRLAWEHFAWIGLTAPLLTYIVVYAGLTPLPKLPLFSRGDYSYGVYLYGFPVQQAVIHLSGTREPLTVFALSVVPITLFAMMSWHLVEKPTLKLRKNFSMAARLERERQKASEAAPADAMPEASPDLELSPQQRG